MSAVAVAGAGVLAVALLAGCTSDAPPASTSLRIVQTDTTSLSGMEALTQGTLVASEDGCVMLATPGDTLVVPAWPRGYSVEGDADSFAILDAEGATFAQSGIPLGMGGGGLDFADTLTETDCARGKSLWAVGPVSPAS